MTKKILYFVLLSVLIMSVGYDIQTGRIQFGSSRINDSTSALMTMNKGLLINGDLYTPDAGKFYIGDNYLNGLANNMGYYSTTHTFYSQDGTTIATFDSASGITFAKDFIPTWTKNNSATNAYQFEKVKIIGTVMPATTGSPAVSKAHGITDWHTIKSWNAVVHEETTNYIYNVNQYYGLGPQWYARVDSLNVYTEIGGSATQLPGDSVFFRIVYTDFQR